VAKEGITHTPSITVTHQGWRQTTTFSSALKGQHRG